MNAVDVVCAGIVVVDHIAAPIPALPRAGELVLTDDCILSIGGCASNVAVDLCKMGVPTAISGCVGDDAFGEFARRVLELHGAETRHLIAIPQVATSQTLIVNVRDQDRRFIHCLGANQHYAVRHMPLEEIHSAKLLYVGGYFLMDSLVALELAQVFKQARDHGVITVLDVVTPGALDYRAALAQLLPYTDVFLPNRDEGERMSGLADPWAQAEAFHAAGAKTVIITDGGEGVYLVQDQGRLRAKAFPTDFVDGTGGGDAFDAGYICGLLEGGDVRRCLELGSALGASCVRRSGATDGVFTRDQAEAFLSEHRLSIEPA